MPSIFQSIQNVPLRTVFSQIQSHNNIIDNFSTKLDEKFLEAKSPIAMQVNGGYYRLCNREMKCQFCAYSSIMLKRLIGT